MNQTLICHSNNYPDASVGKLMNKACNCSDTGISGCDNNCNVGNIDWFLAYDRYLLNCNSVTDPEECKYAVVFILNIISHMNLHLKSLLFFTEICRKFKQSKDHIKIYQLFCLFPFSILN